MTQATPENHPYLRHSSISSVSLSVDPDNDNPSASLIRMCQGGGPAKAGRITGGEVFELLNQYMCEGRLLVGEERGAC